ncbi:putative ABC transporter ATP-binding protein YbhF [Planctomycetes bacterium Pan216]|uniref:Putative ABC transporter ATP-binding protein YbhF n=1 Tax=Kolteria novifilia TaxID=2527975 RepID=A0A518BBL0_9BACT|nr:putative ABC transporter ATP-binding protein YbhF [Planctomycetes bacterium Pan216]
MINVESLSKTFSLASGKELNAVDGVSFEVHAGEVYGLLGPNGAGKTTTLRMLLGLLPSSGGWASVAGFRSDIEPEEVKRRVGLVTSGTGVYRWLSLREMLAFFADLYGVAPDVTKGRIDELAGLLGISHLLDRSCSTLSTGQKQRASLARALIHDPSVVLLDEPTAGLDVMGSQLVAAFIRHLRELGKGAILCTHRLEEAERLCDRFGLMCGGRIISEGTLEELQARTGCETLTDMFLQLSGEAPFLEPKDLAEVKEVAS